MFIGLAVSVFSLIATASETKIFSAYCYDQYYITLPPTAPDPGSWVTGMGRLVNITLLKDPGYPNANENHTHWNGISKANVNGATILLTIDARELNGSVTYKNTLAVTIDGTTAESDGGSYIRAALKTPTTSSGMICNEMNIN